MTGTHQGYKFLSRSARTNLPWHSRGHAAKCALPSPEIGSVGATGIHRSCRLHGGEKRARGAVHGFGCGRTGSLGPPARSHLKKPEDPSQDHEEHQPPKNRREKRGIEHRPCPLEPPQHAPAVEHPVPGGVCHDRGKDNRSHALGDGVAEKELQHGDQQKEHEEPNPWTSPKPKAIIQRRSTLPAPTIFSSAM